ncbi:MAG TPA: PhnD/SsuA/transferrin family substrate-binding protein [Ktedonobacteraceae bacterium]|nr:PhnD/SsuA/transferrin family substrate-binding protein [Ktedonobacteraceae bacterium]
MDTLRFATYLAPNIYDAYAFIARSVGEKIGLPAHLAVGQSFNAFACGQVDVGFLCGLPYTQLADAPDHAIELLAAPVLHGERYQQRPIYFSDVVVRKDSPYTSFDDLRGCGWAYNQRTSHSGWNIVCYNLWQRGEMSDYFGELVETGSHLRSLSLVLDGVIDATAIDSQVLDVFCLQHPEQAESLHVIETFGPSPIPPVVIASMLDSDLKRRVQDILLTLHEDSIAASALHQGAIERFVHVCDEDYNPIRKINREAISFKSL